MFSNNKLMHPTQLREGASGTTYMEEGVCNTTLKKYHGASKGLYSLFRVEVSDIAEARAPGILLV